VYVHKLALREDELVAKGRKERDGVGRLVFASVIHLVGQTNAARHKPL